MRSRRHRSGWPLQFQPLTTLTGIPVQISTAIATAKMITMTTMQKSLAVVAAAAVLGGGIYEARRVSNLGAQIQSFQQRQLTWDEQAEQLRRSRDQAMNQLAELQAENKRLREGSTELAKLRGQVTQLRNPVGEA